MEFKHPPINKLETQLCYFLQKRINLKIEISFFGMTDLQSADRIYDINNEMWEIIDGL